MERYIVSLRARSMAAPSRGRKPALSHIGNGPEHTDLYENGRVSGNNCRLAGVSATPVSLSERFCPSPVSATRQNCRESDQFVADKVTDRATTDPQRSGLGSTSEPRRVLTMDLF